jgi:hypothetical protein
MKKQHHREPLPPQDLERLTCSDCNVNVLEIGEYYMAHPKIWDDELGLGWKDNLCIGCLERRLGRRVSLKNWDLGWPLRYEWMFPESERLMDRYGCVKDDKGKWWHESHESNVKKKKRKR